MKTRIGIVGYGNLGKAVEQTILANPKVCLVAIFSRRTIKSRFGTKVELYDNISDYKNKIDIMLLCGSSKNDLESQTAEVLRYFDVINTFDTHSKIFSEYKKLNKIANTTKHRALICTGWDPGLFSVVRALFLAIGKSNPVSFWGKGVSMGHSDAIRQIPYVDDGLQFTVPIQESIKMAKMGIDNNGPKHERICFVCAEEKRHKEIERNIKNIPNYFKGQPTKVNFVSPEKIMKLKQNMGHKGFVFESFKTTSGLKSQMEFKISTRSNPEFTAAIMTAYINAVINLKNSNQCGCFTPIDIPAKFLFEDSKYIEVLKTIC